MYKKEGSRTEAKIIPCLDIRELRRDYQRRLRRRGQKSSMKIKSAWNPGSQVNKVIEEGWNYELCQILLTGKVTICLNLPGIVAVYAFVLDYYQCPFHTYK